MSLLRYDTIVNGEHLEDFPIYQCDITGIEIPGNFPHFFYNGIHISEEAMDQLVEDWIHRFQKYGMGSYPIILHYLIERCTKRIKRYAHIPKELRQMVLERYKHTCVYCGRKDRLEIDHKHPVSKGGLSELKNLQVLCKTCNVKKGNKIVEEKEVVMT